MHLTHLDPLMDPRKGPRIDRLTPAVYTHETLNMRTLHEHGTQHAAIQVYKAPNDLLPPQVVCMFEYIHDYHNRNTRLAASL